MKITKAFAVASVLVLAAGCSTDSPDGYHTTTTKRGQVISSSPYTNSTYSTYPATPVYSSSGTITQTYSEADRALVVGLREILNNDPSISRYDENVNLNVRYGTVTITGTAPSDQDRRYLESVVRNTSGVVNVQDQLQVAYPPTGNPDTGRVYPPPGATYQPQNQVIASRTAAMIDEVFNLHVQGLGDQDRSLAQRILQGLRTDAVLPTLLPIVDIHVTNGRVTLRGSVQNEEQRRAIVNAVQRASGNVVTDELQVNQYR